jgi:hypothetical protein
MGIHPEAPKSKGCMIEDEEAMEAVAREYFAKRRRRQRRYLSSYRY